MKEIELTQGKVALVDDEDFEELNRFKWYAHKEGNGWYAKRNGRDNNYKRISLFMHHALLKEKIGFLRDHKDGNGLNNQKENLRYANRSQNKFLI